MKMKTNLFVFRSRLTKYVDKFLILKALVFENSSVNSLPIK
jgi:hypothetical protein